MTKKPNLLKGLLATASTVAVLIGGAEAFANIDTTAGTTGGNQAIFSVPGDFNPAGAVADNTVINIANGVTKLTADQARNNVTVNAQGQTFTFELGANQTGLVIDDLAAGAGRVDLKATAGAVVSNMTLTANAQAAGLRDIDVNDKAGFDLTFNSTVNIRNIIAKAAGGGTGHKGTFTFNQSGKITGDVYDAAGKGASSIVVAAGKTLEFNFAGAQNKVITDGLTLNTGSILNLNNTSVAAAEFTVVTTPAAKGIANIAGATKIKVSGLGAIDELHFSNTAAGNQIADALTVNGPITIDSTGELIFSAQVTSQSANFTADGTITSDTAGDYKAVSTTTNTDNTGTLKIKTANATGPIGAENKRLKQVEVGEGGNTTLAGTVNAKKIVVKGNVNTFSEKVNVGDQGTLVFGAAGTAVFSKDSSLGFIELADKAGIITIGDTANVKGTTHSTANNGTINFTKSGSFEGSLGGTGANDNLAAVNFGANDSVVTITGDKLNSTAFNFTGKGTVNLNSKAIAAANNPTTIDFANNDGVLNLISGVSITGGIDSTVGSAGTVNFAGAANVSGAIGATNAIKALNLNGAGLVDVTGVVQAQTINFNADGTLKAGGALASTTGITVKTDNTGKVILSAPSTFAGDIGADKLSLREFNVADSQTLTLSKATGKYYTNFTSTNGKSILTSTNGSTFYGNVGASGNAFDTLEVGDTGADVFKGDVWATTISNTDSDVTFEKTVNGDTFTAANNTTVNLGDNGTLNIAVDGAGTVNLAGNGTINKDLGEAVTNLAEIKFTGSDKTVNVSANLYGDNIVFGKNTVNFTNNVTIGDTAGNSDLDLTDTTVNIAKNTVTLNKLNAAPTVTAGTTLIVARDKTTNGVLDFSAGTQGIDFTPATLKIQGATGLKTGTQFTVVKTNNAATKKFGNVNKTALFSFTNEVINNNVVVTATQTNTIQGYIAGAKGLNSADLEVATVLNRNIPTATGNAAQEIDFVTSTDDKDIMAQRVQKITPNASTATAAAQAVDVTSSAQKNISTRTVDIQAVGAAAGDSASALGAWVKGFYARAVEKSSGNASGYKSNIGGGTIGFDMQANDATVVGAAVTLADTKAKFKGTKAGDKLDGKSMLFNVYGIYDLANNMFVQGDVNFGNTKVKNTTKRNFGTATGKYDVMSYGLSALVGYNMKATEGLVATPMAGLSYGKFLASGYTETGAGASNQIHTKKNFDKIVGTLGLRLIGQMNAGSDMDITPEAHAFVNHDFRAKSLKDEFTIDGLGENIVVKGKKPAKTSYNLGLSLTAKSGNMEYGVGYDAELRNKYTSHQGSVKVRVNF